MTVRTRPSLRGGRKATGVLMAICLAGLAVALLARPGLGVDTAMASSSSLEAAKAELSDAKAEFRNLQARLDRLAQKGEETEAKLDQTRGYIEEVKAKMSKTEKDLAKVRAKLADRLAEMYKNRGSGALEALNTIFAGEDMSLSALAQRTALVGRVAAQDRELVVAVEAKLDELQELVAELREQKETEETDVVEYMDAHDEGLRVLEESKSEYDRLRTRVAQLEAEEEKRREEARRLAEARAAAKAQAAAKAAAAAKTGAAKARSAPNTGAGPITKTNPVVDTSAGWVFPVEGPNSFIDTFGAPRSGGRTHKGTDIMTPLNTPVVAVVNGVIGRTNPGGLGLGGITIHLTGADGRTYYYAHLTSVKSGITKGVRVAAREVIGFAGNTGNARGGETHLHFEIRPGGGAAINPYPTLVRYR